MIESRLKEMWRDYRSFRWVPAVGISTNAYTAKLIQNDITKLIETHAIKSFDPKNVPLYIHKITEARAWAEATPTFEKNQAKIRNNPDGKWSDKTRRTLTQTFNDFYYGQLPEAFNLNIDGFTDDLQPFMDIKFNEYRIDCFNNTQGAQYKGDKLFYEYMEYNQDKAEYILSYKENPITGLCELEGCFFWRTEEIADFRVAIKEKLAS